jgi:hypothetical protein
MMRWNTSLITSKSINNALCFGKNGASIRIGIKDYLSAGSWWAGRSDDHCIGPPECAGLAFADQLSFGFT